MYKVIDGKEGGSVIGGADGKVANRCFRADGVHYTKNKYSGCPSGTEYKWAYARYDHNGDGGKY